MEDEDEDEDEGRWGGDQTIEAEYFPHNGVLLSSEEGEVVRRHGEDFDLGGDGVVKATSCWRMSHGSY